MATLATQPFGGVCVMRKVNHGKQWPLSKEGVALHTSFLGKNIARRQVALRRLTDKPLVGPHKSVLPAFSGPPNNRIAGRIDPAHGHCQRWMD